MEIGATKAPFIHTFMMANDSQDYVEFGWLTTEELKAAIEKIERAELAFAESGGQMTTSIGGVSLTWASREEIEKTRLMLVGILKQRLGQAPYAPYKITHLMR